MDTRDSGHSLLDYVIKGPVHPLQRGNGRWGSPNNTLFLLLPRENQPNRDPSAQVQRSRETTWQVGTVGN